MPRRNDESHKGATIPQDWDEAVDGYCRVTLCVPNSPDWKATVYGLIGYMGKGFYWRADGDGPTRIIDAKRIAEEIYESICMSCNYEALEQEKIDQLKLIAKSIRNSDLAMQFLVAQLRKDKTIYDVIPAPAVGGTLTAASDSHFEAASLLETNGIAELFSIALLDDGTLSLPDLNPFNLESKVDQIRTDINLSKTHFIGSFSQLVEWFATSFRGGVFSDYNPLGAETFFTRFTNTFNAATPTSITVPVPWPPFTYTFTFYMVDKTFSERFTQAFFADDQREPTDSQNYFNRFNTKFDLFNVVHTAMKDCICAANKLLEDIGSNILGIDLTPTTPVNNITITPTTPVNNITVTAGTGTDMDGVEKGLASINSSILSSSDKIAQAISEIELNNVNILNTGETAYINVGDGCCEPPNGAGTGGYTPPSLDEPLPNEQPVPDADICDWVEYTLDTIISFLEWILWAVEWGNYFFGETAVGKLIVLLAKNRQFIAVLVALGLVNPLPDEVVTLPAATITLLSVIIVEAIDLGIQLLQSVVQVVKANKQFALDLFCDYRFDAADIPDLLDDWIDEIIKQLPTDADKVRKFLRLIVKDENIMRKFKYKQVLP